MNFWVHDFPFKNTISPHRGREGAKKNSLGQDLSDVAALTLADVRAQLPRSGSEISVVYTSRIAWVRDALDVPRDAQAALDIPIPDRDDAGECKAALVKYYLALNTTTASRAEAPQALAVSTAAQGPPPQGLKCS